MNSFNLKQTERVVIKIGSSLVTRHGDGLDMSAIRRLAQHILQFRQLGMGVVLVSSGAIAEGMKRLGWQTKPKALNELQAAAAVGQMGLAQAYEVAFEELGMKTAQILLTHEDLRHRTRYLNARSTLRTLLSNDVVPIINENDTVTIDEIKLGDNDTLGALVTNLIEADALIILTDQAGLFDKDPRHHADAKIIHSIEATNPSLTSIAGGAGSAVGTGGMLTKVTAARRAALSGAYTYITSGYDSQDLLSRLTDPNTGTWLIPVDDRMSARQQWLMGQVQLSGRVVLDKGAVCAIVQQNSSLLPVGCQAVYGQFERGALIAIQGDDGVEVARGLVNYSSHEVKMILGVPSHQIEQKLGYMAEDELVHRDNMVLVK